VNLNCIGCVDMDWMELSGDGVSFVGSSEDDN